MRREQIPALGSSSRSVNADVWIAWENAVKRRRPHQRVKSLEICVNAVCLKIES